MLPNLNSPHTWWLLFLLGFSTSSHAQLEDVSLDYQISSTTFGSLFGCGLSTADFNGDGWDDVTASGSDGWIKLYTGGPDGFTLHNEWQMSNEGKAVLWIDIENDGDLDLFVGVLQVGVFLFVQQDDGELIEEGLARGMPVLQNWDVRGFSARDYDRDGDLDLYITSYHDLSQSIIYENMLFQNGGNGYFEDITLAAGVGNGYMHSFQGAWMDFDGNGFDDLWVINDRSIFPNALYSNQGNLPFTDISEDSGSDIGIEAMSATLFDPDNDGDWDQYVTNIEGNPNAFLRNNGGIYEDIAPDAGVDNLLYGWGTCGIDVDGDRWDDMMVATYRFPNTNPYDNILYMNDGSGIQFTEATEDWPNEQFQLYCLGRLDLDGDRTPDVVGHGNAAFAQVLHNTNSEGAARLTVDLVGLASNTFGVGSVIKVHADGLSQMRQVNAGCDYMTQHTYTRFFGLGDVQLIDSIEVFWPTGAREVFFDVPSDTALVIAEGVADAALEFIPPACPWSSGSWSLPFDPETTDMTWNGEPVTSSIVVADSAGAWTLEASWWNEDYTWSETVNWSPQPEPDLEIEVEPGACYGDSGLISWDFGDFMSVMVSDSLWPNTVSAAAFSDGAYAVDVEVNVGCTVALAFEVNAPPPLTAEAVVLDPLCFGESGSAEVVIGGGTPPLSLDVSGVDLAVLWPGVWPYVLSDSLGCALTDTLVVSAPDSLVSVASFAYLGVTDSAQVSLDIEGGTPPYTISWSGPLGADGWVLAPAGLGWYVQDYNGCLSLGALDIQSNPLADVTPLNGQVWGCERLGGRFVFDGPAGGDLEVVFMDLTGRAMAPVQRVQAGGVLSCSGCGTVVIQGRSAAGGTYSWVR